MTTAYDKLAARIKQAERRLDSRNHPQLAHQAIHDGAIHAYEREQVTLVVGRQFDGTNGAFAVAGPTPPRCSAATITVVRGGFVVRWDGTFAATKDDQGTDYIPVAPMDFMRADIHVTESILGLGGDTLGLLEDQPRGSIATVRGGSQFISLSPDTSYDVTLVTWTFSGKYSDPSPIVTATTQEDSTGGEGDILEQAKEYARDQDVLTLAAANEYTDAHGGARTLEYTFAVADDTWTIDHDLGTKAIEVLVFDMSDRRLPADVTYPTDDQIQVNWVHNETGVVRLLY